MLIGALILIPIFKHKPDPNPLSADAGSAMDSV